MKNNYQFNQNPYQIIQKPQEQGQQIAQLQYETISIEGNVYSKFQPPIDQGSQCIVYKGQNVQTKEIVAIKEYKQIDQNELKAIQAIQRNNFTHIIRIIGVLIKQKGLTIVVTEFVNGDFQQFMQTEKYKNLSYEDKNLYFVQMMKGLEQLQQLELFHINLKPESFAYINRQNNEMFIKLIYFELVKEITDQMARNQRVVTPYYMAPEVFGNQNNSYDKSVDIWSLGAIWYELLTNETFFNGNTQEEIVDKIKNIKQEDIDRQIQDNNRIQEKEKHFIKQMLQRIPSQRISLKEFNSIETQEKKENIEQEQNSDELKKQQDEELKQKLEEFQLKKQEEMAQRKRDIERNIDDELAPQLLKKDDRLKREKENQITQKEKELKDIKVQQAQGHQQDRHLEWQSTEFQQEIQFQNEMEQFKKQMDDEYQKEFDKIKQDAQNLKVQKVQEELKMLEAKLILQITEEIEKKYQLLRKNQIALLDDQKNKEIQELQDKKQQLLNELEYFQSTNKIFSEKLTEKYKIINEINSQDRKKQELLTYINDELQKHKEIILKNEQRQNLIQQAQKKEKLQEYNELTQENEQYQKYQMVIIQRITQEQGLLENQVKYKEILDEQRKQQELITKMEQEEKLTTEKEQYKSQLTIVKQQLNQQFSYIQQIQDQITFYQRIQIQNQGEEKIQDVIKYHQLIIQDIQIVEFQEKIIQQYESLQQQITTYQSCNSKLEEIEKAQNTLKTQIEEANKCIQQIDKEYLDKHQQQIEEFNKKLIDYQEKYQYLSTNQKYSNQITQIINQIGQAFGELNNLKQLISQRTLPAYQQYIQINQQIQQSLKSFEKQYNQIHQQIYNDEQIELKNQEKIKKLSMAKDQLDKFIIKMNQFKDQVKNLIKNEYCNNEKTQNLINTKLTNIDQNIKAQQERFTQFTQLNQYDSCENINNQIKQLEEIQGKLKEVEVNEIEYINQLKLIILNVGEENKSQQEKEILTLNNQLQTRYREYTKALQSIKFQFQSVEFYEQINQKKEILQQELHQEISILNKYSEIQNTNAQLIQQNQKTMFSKKGIQQQGLQQLLEKFKYICHQKGQRLENIIKNVSQIQNELHFCQMDDNLIKNYEQLKIQEEQLSTVLTSINQKISNQQLKPQQLNELKEYILNVYNDIDELMKKIPENNEIEKFNQAYQYNLESYQKAYALINYIKQYHLTRYYERIKENANSSKKKQQNNIESDYQKQFQSKLNVGQEENTKKEKEAQDILFRYENVLLKNYYKKTIKEMEKDKEQIEKQTLELENYIKSKNLVKFRSNLKDQNIIKDIINTKQYYKIFEFMQETLYEEIRIKETIQQGQQY